MMVNIYGLVIITLIMTFITNKVLDLGFLKGGIVTLVILTLGYIIYIKNKQTKRYSILEEELDPNKFISETHKAYKHAGKDKQLNSLYNLDLSFGYMSLGEYDKSLDCLKKVDYKRLPKMNYSAISYFTALMITYFNLGDEEKALDAYNQALKLGFNGDKVEKLTNILNANKYLYDKEYDKSKELFESSINGKISKRFNLEVLYVLAFIDQKQGHINDAAIKYEKISKEANKLNIKKLADKNLLELKNNI